MKKSRQALQQQLPEAFDRIQVALLVDLLDSAGGLEETQDKRVRAITVGGQVVYGGTNAEVSPGANIPPAGSNEANNITGPIGATGAKGDTGIAGEKGETGEKGEKGDTEWIANIDGGRANSVYGGIPNVDCGGAS
jgi:hypothetical protein